MPGRPQARLLYIEALLGSDYVDTADQEMTLFLNGRDVKKMPPQVAHDVGASSRPEEGREHLRQED